MLDRIQTIVRGEGVSAVFRRALAKVVRESGALYDERAARCKGSYSLQDESAATRLSPRLAAADLDVLPADQCIPQQVARYYLDHRFDLLGSGWVEVRYGMRCGGLAGYRYNMGDAAVTDTQGQWLAARLNASNRATAQRIWQRVDFGYQPIDWQLDFKSGYRWSESTWAARLPYGHLLGVDVKVPWELSRMQHLPQMALRAGALGAAEGEAQQLVRDIRNQWLDFIAANPPGFGVNWVCPMDIAIRGANWCLAWDILQASGFSIDIEDVVILHHSLYDHGRYIVNHLEWSRDRANHYLADICGLAFIAAYLPETHETDCWLAFAIGQLQFEILRQFLPDGGSFEGSTAYHRLSAEMVIYTTALTLGLPQARLARLAEVDPGEYAYLPRAAGIQQRWSLHDTAMDAGGSTVHTPFEPKTVERLQGAVSFFAAILKPDGALPQIGDNDGGRFLKIQPVYSVMSVRRARQEYLNLNGYDQLEGTAAYFLEDGLNGLHLRRVAAALGLADTRRADATRPIAPREPMERRIVTALAGGNTFRLPARTVHPMGAFAYDNGAREADFSNQWHTVKMRPDSKAHTYNCPPCGDASLSEPAFSGFEHFGCIVFRRPGLYLLIRCMVQSERRLGGHYHDDQLSLELEIEGKPVIRDPGTFVYTSLPSERIRYRSAPAHFSPLLWADRARGKTDVFDHPVIQPATVDFCGQYGFAAHITMGHHRVDLMVRLGRHEIAVLHAGIPGTSFPTGLRRLPPPYSPSYGIQRRSGA